MKFKWVPALAAIGLAGLPPGQAAETTLEQMPLDLDVDEKGLEVALCACRDALAPRTTTT